MQLYESAENYLEAVLMLEEKNGLVRSVDIANELNFSKPSVSIAIKKLRQSGYIEMDGSSLISLTPAGRAVAESVYERHRILTALLMALGVSEENARADACRLEHVLSDESWNKIKAHAVAHGIYSPEK